MAFRRAIDSHVHVWTANDAMYPWAAGYSRTQIHPFSFTAEELLAAASPFGVARIVLIQMDFYGFDNSYLLDTICRYPDVFVGVAQVDEHCADPTAELRRLKSLGVRGVRIAPVRSGDPAWLDGPGMQAIWECCAREQMSICPLIEAIDLPTVARACQNFPDTTVVIDHFAGIGSDGQIRASDVQGLCELARWMNTYVKLSAFYYLGRKCPPYEDLVPMSRQLLDAFGPKRLMWGSDAPFQLEPPNVYQASLEFISNRLDFITSGDKEWLLERTAEKVFFS